jgi:DNA-damage-inducible protein D
MSEQNTEIATLFASFEDCCFEHEGTEAWRARKLMPLFGYDRWENFRNAIERRGKVASPLALILR